MSLFLGPIHHDMYGKIRTTWMRAGAVLGALVDAHGEAVEHEAGLTRAAFTSFNGDQPLEELVAGSGIHDWLQQQIDRAEQTEASIVAAGRRVAGDAAIATARDAARRFGVETGGRAAAEHGGPATDAETLFQLLDAYQLETMPCTQVTEFGALPGGAFAYRHAACPHTANWEAAGGDPGNMCSLITAWIAGFTQGAARNLRHDAGSRILAGERYCEDTFVVVDEAPATAGEGAMAGSGAGGASIGEPNPHSREKENGMRVAVEQVLEEIRPMLVADGGEVDLIDIADGIVKLRLRGACAGCPAAASTLYGGIEQMLKERVPGVQGVEAVE